MILIRVCVHTQETFQLLFFMLAVFLPAVHFITVTLFYFLKTTFRELKKIISELISISNVVRTWMYKWSYLLLVFVGDGFHLII